MKKEEKYFTLEEIRKAQSEIVDEMGREDLPGIDKQKLEQASQHLRNIERLLVKSKQDELFAALKKQTHALAELTVEMNRASEKLSRIGGTLQKIVKITGRIIDILDMVK